MKTKILGVTTVILSASVAFALALGTFQATLTGANGAKGKAKFVTKQRNGGTQAELDVEGENLRANTDFTVTIESSNWQVHTDALGRFSVPFRYRGVGIPNIGAGTAVSVTNGAGATVLSGVFQAK